MLVFDLAVARLEHAFDSLAEAADVMLAPPARKFRARLFEVSHPLDECQSCNCHDCGY
jgi:hypothetical protein